MTRIFIACLDEDGDRAKELKLLRCGTNLDLEFVGPNLPDPATRTDPDYLAGIVREQLAGTTVTIVLVGRNTATNERVQSEITWSLQKRNGILAISLEVGVVMPSALVECGAEILAWDLSAFCDAVERAILQASRSNALQKAGTDVGSGCSR